MIEKLIEDDEFVIDTPFLRRLREKAQIEAKAEGRAEGALSSRRHDVLNVIVWRFDPLASVYQQIEQVLATIADDAQLATLHKAAVQANALADFQATLTRITTPAPTQSE